MTSFVLLPSLQHEINHPKFQEGFVLLGVPLWTARCQCRLILLWFKTWPGTHAMNCTFQQLQTRINKLRQKAPSKSINHPLYEKHSGTCDTCDSKILSCMKNVLFYVKSFWEHKQTLKVTLTGGNSTRFKIILLCDLWVVFCITKECFMAFIGKCRETSSPSSSQIHIL